MDAVSAVLIALTAVSATVVTATGAAKLAALPDMRSRADHLGFSVAGFRAIGALEVAGAVGVVTGLSWAPLGIAAAAGLVAMMVGAVVSHVRAGDRPVDAAPAIAVGGALVALLVLQVQTA